MVVDVTKQDFTSALYTNVPATKSFKSLQFVKQKNEMALLTKEKKIVNSVYIKFFVKDNLITCEPFNNTA